MARSLWTGSVSFGLVNVPVILLAAVRDVDLHFRQLHAKDGAPVNILRWCPEEDVEVAFDDVTHSYELESGGQVVVTDEELEAIEPRRTRTIDIELFVDLAEVDPVYFDHPYFLAPAGSDDGALRAYRLLVEVMQRSQRAAVGRFVMRAKEHLAIIRSREETLTLTTMRFADEVRPRETVDGARSAKLKPARKQLDGAVAVIEELSRPWQAERHEDLYRKRLEQVIARKRKGETVKAPSADFEPSPVPDLMAALERTLAELK